MNYYSRSNLAYDFALFEETESDELYMRRRGRKNDSAADEAGSANGGKVAEDAGAKSGVKKIRRRKSNYPLIAIAVVFGVMIAFVVASIIHGQVQLTELNQEIADAKSNLAELQSSYTQYEMKVDSSISTTAVEDYAKTKLGMTKAGNSQKEFIKLSDGDKAEVTMSEDKNIFTVIADAFSSLWS